MISMAQVSSEVNERSRKAYSKVLQRLSANGTARGVALALGVSESTVSRIKNEKLEEAVRLIYQLGFKVVDESKKTVDGEFFKAMSVITGKFLSQPGSVNRIIEGGE